MIELKNTVKKFDTFTALDNVDLKIEKGTAFGLLGSNGAGKSTILRLISGIYSPESGEVLIDGKKVYDNVEAKQKVFLMVAEAARAMIRKHPITATIPCSPAPIPSLLPV